MRFAPRWIRYSFLRRRNIWLLLLAFVVVSVWYLMTPPSEPLSKKRYRGGLDSSCHPRHPLVLFFNRIPKSGSTTLQDFFRSLSSFVDVEVEIYPQGADKWSISDVEEVEDRSMKLLKHAKLLHGGDNSDSYIPHGIYIQHFFYTEFPGLSAFGANYGYVTLLREPVDRVISAYYYYHFTKNFKMPPGHKQASLSECVRGELYGCEANLMTQYFCGHEDSCASKNGEYRYAFYTATQNMQKYIAVGITEDFLTSVKLFQRLLPDFIPEFVELPRTLKKQNANELDYMKDVTESEITEIKEKNFLDIRMYALARELFEAKVKACDIKIDEEILVE